MKIMHLFHNYLKFVKGCLQKWKKWKHVDIFQAQKDVSTEMEKKNKKKTSLNGEQRNFFIGKMKSRHNSKNGTHEKRSSRNKNKG